MTIGFVDFRRVQKSLTEKLSDCRPQRASASRLGPITCCVPLSSWGEASACMSSTANLSWSMDGLRPTASQVHPLKDDNVKPPVRPQAIGELGVPP
jgi:hypothetical protein